VLFVPGSAPDASFVRADREALAARVRVVEVVPRRGWRQLTFFAAVVHRLAADRPALAVVWFASPTYGALTAAACRLARVPWLVVSGGLDVAAVPDIAFGNARGGWRRALARRVLEGASLVWAFSDSARREIERSARPRAIAVVAPAVDTGFFRPPPGPRLPRERLVLSTCAAITAMTILQKGLDRLVEAARALDDVAIVITGRVDGGDPAVRAFVAEAPPNVTFAGHVSREALRTLYARAAVVAQLSRHEGFGVAVAEAVAMGCVVATTPLAVFDEIVPEASRVRVPAGAAGPAMARLLREALASAPPPQWAEIDRRYGIAVRAAAWDAWLAAEGLI
jgi:glycosyltransferase involved in cell wall biosynthesis